MDGTVLHSEEDSLQRFRGGCDLAELVRAARAGEKPVRLALWRKNIGRVPQIVAWLRSEAAVDLPDVEPWNPAPADRLADNLMDYYRYLKTVLEPHGLLVDRPDPDLFDLCRRIEAADLSPSDKLRLLGVATESVFVGPRVFHLDMTNDCNTNCLYCWFHSPLSRKRPDAHLLDERWKKTYMDTEIAKRLIRDLARLGTKEDLVLSGKGEPVLHGGIVDVISEAKGCGISVTLFCNGIELGRRMREAILRYEVDLLYVSVSAATYGTYIRLHPRQPKDEFRTIVKNVAEFIGERNRRQAGRPHVVWVMVICYTNAHEVLAFYELGRALGVDLVRFQLMAAEPYNRGLALRPAQFDGVIRQIERARALESAGGPKIVENIGLQLARLKGGDLDWTRGYFETHPCTAGWMFSRAWAGGEVAFCCSPKVIANLNDVGFYDLWWSEEYRRYRRAAKYIQSHRDVVFKNGARLYNEHCHRCPNYEQIAFMEDIAGAAGLSRFLAK